MGRLGFRSASYSHRAIGRRALITPLLLADLADDVPVRSPLSELLQTITIYSPLRPAVVPPLVSSGIGSPRYGVLPHDRCLPWPHRVAPLAGARRQTSIRHSTGFYRRHDRKTGAIVTLRASPRTRGLAARGRLFRGGCGARMGVALGDAQPAQHCVMSLPFQHIIQRRHCRVGGLLTVATDERETQ